MRKPIEICVISGKGGTGKTVLASSVAALMDGKVIADCDVDAPDLHLLLKPTIAHEEVFSGAKVASIDQSVCTGCGKCLEVCRFEAVRAEPDGEGVTYTIDDLDCEGCGVCSWMCPAEAIGLKEAAGGKWYISDTRFGKLVHANLGVAQENSGKLVTIVRREARKLALDDGLRFVLIDGPPGIGCPVIASIAGVDLAVIVTEPTMSGIHDLERTLQLTGHFGLRAGAVINKFDLNRDMANRIEAFLDQNGIRLLGKIPFGTEVNRAIAQSKVIVEAGDSPVAAEIRLIAKRIMGMVSEDGGPEGASKGRAEGELAER
jgi:MinD superfamily P-loop ATPase